MAEQTTSAAPGHEAAEYGPAYFRHDCGVPYERSEHWLGFFGRVADGVVRDLHPSSVLDAGCAMGFLVEALHERGVDARGIDVSEYAISQVADSVAERCAVASLTDPVEGRYDLVVCIETLEHLDPADADTAIANLCACTDRLLLSSTPSDFGEPTHRNVQPPESWSARLAREGFLRDLDRDLSYITPWAALYVRSEEPLPETVRRYDRAWWRARREAGEVRDALLGAHRRVAELEEQLGDERPEDPAELDLLREEVLRLRDLLIAKDAEMGTMRGRLTELESHSQRLVNAAQRIHSRVPALLRLLGGALRRLRRGRG